MRFDVITIFPGMLHSITKYGVTGRAIEQGLLELHSWDLRDYTQDRNRTVDDRPYGGGPGMVMKAEPLDRAVNEIKNQLSNSAKVVLLSPQGQLMKQEDVKKFVQCDDSIILVAGRYEGVDERFVDKTIDEEWSIGDYVLSGGELPAMVLIDAVARLIPGVLGHNASAEQDSFMQGLLDCPHYTRPELWNEGEVPKVLLSGDRQRIEHWRRKQALGRTWCRRPELIEVLNLDQQDQQLLDEFKKELKDNES